jgi:tetratricopeptide (TPR) repeat protein
MRRNIIINGGVGFSLLCIVLCSSCKKQDEFLAAVPSQSLSLPNTLDALYDLVNNDRVFNGSDPGLGVIAGESFYVLSSSFNSSDALQKNMFTWNSNPYPGQPLADWINAWQQVYTANTVLENIDKIAIRQDQQATHDLIKGASLFFRAKIYFSLMDLFTLPYDSAKSKSELGLQLKLNSDLTVVSTRASEEDCYRQIIKDLSDASQLLPNSTKVPTIPNKPAAFGLLARVFLAMGKYSGAEANASSALNINSTITDYNDLPLSESSLTDVSQYPLSEDVFHSGMNYYNLVGLSRGIVDSNLYNLYDSNDLRKTAYYFVYPNGTPHYKGSYEFKIGGIFYDGISNDELYLIRAECEARRNDIADANSDMTALLDKRYKTGSYPGVHFSEAGGLLYFILKERQKELFGRGLRWMDLRRLNLDPTQAVTLLRTVNGVSYSLPPNDLRYAFLIPDDEIKSSGIAQNGR